MPMKPDPIIQTSQEHFVQALQAIEEVLKQAVYKQTKTRRPDKNLYFLHQLTSHIQTHREWPDNQQEFGETLSLYRDKVSPMIQAIRGQCPWLIQEMNHLHKQVAVICQALNDTLKRL